LRIKMNPRILSGHLLRAKTLASSTIQAASIRWTRSFNLPLKWSRCAETCRNKKTSFNPDTGDYLPIQAMPLCPVRGTTTNVLPISAAFDSSVLPSHQEDFENWFVLFATDLPQPSRPDGRRRSTRPECLMGTCARNKHDQRTRNEVVRAASLV